MISFMLLVINLIVKVQLNSYSIVVNKENFMSRPFSQKHWDEVAKQQFDAMDSEAQDQWGELRHRLHLQ